MGERERVGEGERMGERVGERVEKGVGEREWESGSGRERLRARG